MFITSTTYQNEIITLIDVGQPVSAAIAFIGNGIDEILGRSTARVRLLCNLLSGGTNPDAIDALRQYKNIEIKHLSNLHAKVIFNESTAIIGSANLSQNGLTENPKTGSGWHEAGYLARKHENLAEICAWFEDLWGTGLPVTDEDLAKARLMWSARRTASFIAAGHNGARFGDITREQIENIPIYLSIYQERASERAISAARQKLSEVQPNGEQQITVSPYDIFEDWPTLPTDGPLLCFRLDGSGSLTGEGAWQYMPELDTSYSDKRRRVNVFFASRKKKVLTWKYNSSDERLLSRRLKPALDRLMAARKRGREDVLMRLSEALKIADIDVLHDGP